MMQESKKWYVKSGLSCYTYTILAQPASTYLNKVNEIPSQHSLMYGMPYVVWICTTAIANVRGIGIFVSFNAMRRI